MKGKVFILLLMSLLLVNGQTSTNSTGSGNFNNSATWTSPKDLTGTVNITNGHTVTIPSGTTVYSDQITFAGTAKLELTSGTSKWIAATIFNPSPPIESLSTQTNWSASSVFINDAFGISHNTPWIDSGQAWSASTANSGTDFLQYDLRTIRWVQGIVTQGRANADQWVTTARVDVSPDNTNWVTVYSNVALNTNRNTKVFINFPKVMFARYVRVTPITVVGFASMRLGILLRDQLFRSCKEILDNNPSAVSGVYVIDPDGIAGVQPSTNCYCDMTTDGGGWTLVLNYLHRGGTNPALLARTNSLPLLGSTTLGTDESASTTTWGHTTPAYLNTFPFSEVRFYGATAGHGRIIHFKTAHANTLNYFKSGTGSMTGVNGSFTALAGHTGFLPNSASSFFVNEGNFAMTNFPFWLGATYHWGIRGQDYRWEMDDYPANGGSGFQHNTFHQIWIR
jgi:hypothetical protein